MNDKPTVDRNSSNMKLKDIFQAAFCIFVGLLIVCGIGGCVASMIKHDQAETAKMVVKCKEMTAESISHPSIIGTNEMGFTIKRYYIYFPYGDSYSAHTIYEIGNTKTTIISHGKFGTEVNVELSQ